MTLPEALQILRLSAPISKEAVNVALREAMWAVDVTADAAAGGAGSREIRAAAELLLAAPEAGYPYVMMEGAVMPEAVRLPMPPPPPPPVVVMMMPGGGEGDLMAGGLPNKKRGKMSVADQVMLGVTCGVAVVVLAGAGIFGFGLLTKGGGAPVMADGSAPTQAELAGAARAVMKDGAATKEREEGDSGLFESKVREVAALGIPVMALPEAALREEPPPTVASASSRDGSVVTNEVRARPRPAAVVVTGGGEPPAPEPARQPVRREPTAQEVAAAARDAFEEGVALMSGNGVAQNKAEGSRLIAAAATAGHAPAQYWVGLVFADKAGGDAEAVRWFHSAAQHGHGPAQMMLGLAYHRGRGVGRNDAQAAQWFRAAAQQGDGDAMYLLGWLDERGSGVPLNMASAVRWYAAAAERDVWMAQEAMGQLYLEGVSVRQDVALSYKWLWLAWSQAPAGASSSRLENELAAVAGVMRRSNLEMAMREISAFLNSSQAKAVGREARLAALQPLVNRFPRPRMMGQ